MWADYTDSGSIPSVSKQNFRKIGEYFSIKEYNYIRFSYLILICTKLQAFVSDAGSQG